PGVQETFGLTSLESQACGTPVVGIRGSYMDRIIFGDQELWADANTPEALAEAIEDLSTQELGSLGEIVSQRAREHYAWPRVFERLFCIYREACGNYRRFPG
ncbi:MAG: glycosyltransferase, partial [Chthoniobacterales bacterium]